MLIGIISVHNKTELNSIKQTDIIVDISNWVFSDFSYIFPRLHFENNYKINYLSYIKCEICGYYICSWCACYELINV